MVFKLNEVYKCPDPECGCEVTVTKGANPGQGGDNATTCCCGKTMLKKG